jgi:hypothetical protein
MSMIGHLRRISVLTYARLREDPSGMDEVVEHGAAMFASLPDDVLKRISAGPPKSLLDAMPSAQRAQIEAQMAAMLEQVRKAKAEPVAAPTPGLGPSVSVEKMWHALHFVIAKRAWEPGSGKAGYILGGQECGEDVGYGPARLLSAEEVATIARELPTAEELHKDFDPKALAAADIYPSVWDEEPDDLWDEIASYYAQVRGLYLDAAKAGDAMVLWMD